MPWYAVVDDADGTLVSIASVLPAQLRVGLVAIEQQGDPRGAPWDAVTRSFGSIPIDQHAVVEADLFAKVKTGIGSAKTDLAALPAPGSRTAIQRFQAASLTRDIQLARLLLIALNRDDPTDLEGDV